MTRTLGAGLSADIAAATAERCQFIELDFADLSNNPTPVYLTTANQDITWNAHTWQAVGGTMDLDALGESDDPTQGHRMKLSGVSQTVLSLILGSRWRGRNATIYHVPLDPVVGTVKVDPVIMFSGPMNGGFSLNESRGDFGGGTVDIDARLTSRLGELTKVRGIRTNIHSHQATVAGATTDTFFQNVDNLMLRKPFWGVKSATNPIGYLPPVTKQPLQEGPSRNPLPPGGSPYSPPGATPPTANPPSAGGGTGVGSGGSPWGTPGRA